MQFHYSVGLVGLSSISFGTNVRTKASSSQSTNCHLTARQPLECVKRNHKLCLHMFISSTSKYNMFVQLSFINFTYENCCYGYHTTMSTVSEQEVYEERIP